MRFEHAVRLLVPALASVLVTCGVQANRPDPEHPPGRRASSSGSQHATADPEPDPPKSAPNPDHFDPGVVSPPEGSARARARTALKRAESSEARRIAEQALDEASTEEALRLRWLAAEAAEAEGDRSAALELLGPVAGSDHPLARWAQLRRAEWLEEREPGKAADHASELTADPWAGQHRARVVQARALAEAGHTERAVPKLRALVEEAPSRVGAASAGMPLAEILAARDDVDARIEALRLYRRVATRAPLSEQGKEAEKKARKVLRGLPATKRRELRRIPLEDALARAHALYRAVRHEKAEKAFERVVGRMERESDPLCRAMLQQGRAIYRQRERERAAKHMKRLAGQCSATDIQAWAHYYAARSHAARGENQQAIVHYEKLGRAAPKHRLADDALYRAALTARAEGDTKLMVRKLERLAEEYPDGDMRGDGAFLLAWHLRTEGKHQRALEQLDQLLEQGPQEHDEDIVGRAAYWRARTLAELGRKEQAREAHAELARTAPLAYYAQQSIARLDELAPERAAAVRERMRQQEPLAPLTFPKRAEMQQAGFTRALELLRVGATHLALDEFDHLGLTGEGADRDLRWLTAALLDRAGAHPEASRMVRRQLPSFRETMPTGRARHLWRLAYPKAFSPLIEEVAKQRGVPASFVRAVAREESGFDPRAVSIAHAYGLIQLIKPTAKRFARTLGLPSDPASLKTPKINLQIGTRYIEYLWKRFDNPAVVPAAYNAGGGAAHGWIEKRGHLPLDAWIEEIPYDETRRYTRRVLQTYGIYSWLDSSQLPPLRAQL